MMNRRNRYWILSAAMICGLYTNVSVAAEGDVFVAGVQPDQRPADAPIIKETQQKKERAWYDKAVTGLYPPFPASFRFLDSQGNWYTPFIRPGMTGRYDIRGWHKPKAQ
jgi:hypothetical protein